MWNNISSLQFCIVFLEKARNLVLALLARKNKTRTRNSCTSTHTCHRYHCDTSCYHPLCVKRAFPKEKTFQQKETSVRSVVRPGSLVVVCPRGFGVARNGEINLLRLIMANYSVAAEREASKYFRFRSAMLSRSGARVPLPVMPSGWWWPSPAMIHHRTGINTHLRGGQLPRGNQLADGRGRFFCGLGGSGARAAENSCCRACFAKCRRSGLSWKYLGWGAKFDFRVGLGRQGLLPYS